MSLELISSKKSFVPTTLYEYLLHELSDDKKEKLMKEIYVHGTEEMKSASDNVKEHMESIDEILYENSEKSIVTALRNGNNILAISNGDLCIGQCLREFQIEVSCGKIKEYLYRDCGDGCSRCKTRTNKIIDNVINSGLVSKSKLNDYLSYSVTSLPVRELIRNNRFEDIYPIISNRDNFYEEFSLSCPPYETNVCDRNCEKCFEMFAEHVKPFCKKD